MKNGNADGNLIMDGNNLIFKEGKKYFKPNFINMKIKKKILNPNKRLFFKRKCYLNARHFNNTFFHLHF